MNLNALSRVERLRIYDKYLKVYQADCDLIDALNHANRPNLADVVRDSMNRVIVQMDEIENAPRIG